MQPTTFTRWIKKLRAEQDLTQEMLAELVGCAKPTLSALETGARRPSRAMAERIADVLQVPADQREEFLRLARQPTDEPDDAKPSRAAPPPVENPAPPPTLPALPHDPTPLIGREAERNTLHALLRDEQHRLVTIVGAGGMGKTRLALDLTASLANHFVDGAGFVPLAAIHQVQHLPSAIASGLNLPVQGVADLQEQVNRWLAPRHLLLTLDNFEQLLADAALVPWIHQLLAAAPRLHLLITSRERLRVSGERSFELSGLSLPSANEPLDQSAAARLFLERAQAVGDFEIDASNRTALSRICHLVEGMPLALELAAAWTHVLLPHEIADEISRSIDFLALAHRDMTPRHRSMRAVFDHSWKLLREDERHVLLKLAVFQGGCMREAAQAVAGAPLPVLASLIDKSLLRKSQGTPTRYTLHELVRQYAADLLQAEPALAATVTDAHAAYYHQLVVAAQPRIWTADIANVLRLLDAENDNVRTALAYYLAQPTGVEPSISMAGSLWRFWQIRGYISEGRTWLGRALQRGVDPPAPSRWLALHGAGNLAGNQADHRVARQHYQESLQVLQQALPALTDPEAIRTTHYRIANSLTNLGTIAFAQGDMPQAQAYGEEALALHRQVNGKVGMSLTLGNLAQVKIRQRQLDQAEPLVRESLTICQELGDERMIGLNLSALGNIAYARGQYEQAAQFYQAAQTIYARLDDQADMAWLYCHLGELAQAQNNRAEAETHYEAGLTLAQRLGAKNIIALLLDRLSVIASQDGRYPQALTWSDQSIALYRAIGHATGLNEALHHRATLTAAL